MQSGLQAGTVLIMYCVRSFHNINAMLVRGSPVPVVVSTTND